MYKSGIERRGFLKLFPTLFATIALGAGGVLATPFLWLLWRASPFPLHSSHFTLHSSHFKEAFRAKFYPGPLERMDEQAVAKPGKWAG